MFVFISFGVWVVAFGDGMGGVSSHPQFLRHWGLPRCSPFGRNIRPIPHPHPPSSFGTGGYPDVRPLGEMYPILDMKRRCVVTLMFALWAKSLRALSSGRPLQDAPQVCCLLGGGLVGVEPVGGGAVAGGEAHATVVGILHLGNDDVLHLRQFARHHVEVQLVVHLQNHA